MDLDIDISLEEPFFCVSTPPPPIHGQIDNYIINSSLLDEPTDCSYIYLCSDINDNQKKVIKFIKFFKEKIPRIVNEITTMRIIDHPNIIKLERYFRYDAYACIIIPYAQRRSILWLLLQHHKNGLPEDIASLMFYQMLSAVAYLHNMNIWHRDIKPDNFLLFEKVPGDRKNRNKKRKPEKSAKNDENQSNTNDDDDDDEQCNDSEEEEEEDDGLPFKVALSDFGFAKVFNPDETCDKYMGTPEYLPPEMINKKTYNSSADIWSLGITLFVMLTGHFPVPNGRKFRRECYRKISTGNLNFHLLKDLDISPEAQDLVMKMCAFNPSDRITASKALNHPWIKSRKRIKTETEQSVVDCIGRADEYKSQDAV